MSVRTCNCAYVRVCIHPKNVCNFNEIWHVCRGRRVMLDSMQYNPIQSKVKVMSPSKLEIRLFSNAIFSAIYNGSWQLTTDS